MHSAESHREILQYESLCNQNCLHEGKKVASRIKTQESEGGLAGRKINAANTSLMLNSKP